MGAIVEFVNMQDKGDYKKKVALTYKEIQFINYLIEERIQVLEKANMKGIEDRLTVESELKLATDLNLMIKSQGVRSTRIDQYKKPKGTEGVDGITAASINLLTGETKTQELTKELEEEWEELRKKDMSEVLEENQMSLLEG